MSKLKLKAPRNGGYASESVAIREARRVVIQEPLAGPRLRRPESFRVYLTRFGWGFALVGSMAETEIIKHGTDDGEPVFQFTEPLE